MSSEKMDGKNKIVKKRNWKKIILWTLGSLAAFVVVAVVALIIFLNSVVKFAIDDIGSRATGTTVSVQDVNISLLHGQLVLNGLAVGNPADYLEKNALSFSKLDVDIDLSTLNSDMIVIDHVVIEDLSIDYELGLSGSNLTDIQKNVEHFAGLDQVKTQESQPAVEQGTESDVKKKDILIKKVVIAGGQITLSNKFLGQKITIPLPEIVMDNLGGPSKNYFDVINEFLVDLFGSIKNLLMDNPVINFDYNAFGNDLTNGISDIGTKALDATTQGLSELGTQGADGAAKAVDAIDEGITSGINLIFSKDESKK